MKKILAIIFLSSLLLFSCNSIKSNESFSSFDKPFNENIVCNECKVYVNTIHDSEISIQTGELLNTKLKSLSTNTSSTQLNLELTITQRSYIRNFENIFSIFANVKVFDQNKNLKYSNCFYTTTKETIISSKEQNLLTEKIIDDLNAAIKNGIKDEK